MTYSIFYQGKPDCRICIYHKFLNPARISASDPNVLLCTFHNQKIILSKLYQACPEFELTPSIPDPHNLAQASVPIGMVAKQGKNNSSKKRRSIYLEYIEDNMCMSLWGNDLEPSNRLIASVNFPYLFRVFSSYSPIIFKNETQTISTKSSRNTDLGDFQIHPDVIDAINVENTGKFATSFPFIPGELLNIHFYTRPPELIVADTRVSYGKLKHLADVAYPFSILGYRIHFFDHNFASFLSYEMKDLVKTQAGDQKTFQMFAEAFNMDAAVIARAFPILFKGQNHRPIRDRLVANEPEVNAILQQDQRWSSKPENVLAEFIDDLEKLLSCKKLDIFSFTALDSLYEGANCAQFTKKWGCNIDFLASMVLKLGLWQPLHPIQRIKQEIFRKNPPSQQDFFDKLVLLGWEGFPAKIQTFLESRVVNNPNAFIFQAIIQGLPLIAGLSKGGKGSKVPTSINWEKGYEFFLEIQGLLYSVGTRKKKEPLPMLVEYTRFLFDSLKIDTSDRANTKIGDFTDTQIASILQHNYYEVKQRKIYIIEADPVTTQNIHTIKKVCSRLARVLRDCGLFLPPEIPDYIPPLSVGDVSEDVHCADLENSGGLAGIFAVLPPFFCYPGDLHHITKFNALSPAEQEKFLIYIFARRFLKRRLVNFIYNLGLRGRIFLSDSAEKENYKNGKIEKPIRKFLDCVKGSLSGAEKTTENFNTKIKAFFSLVKEAGIDAYNFCFTGYVGGFLHFIKQTPEFLSTTPDWIRKNFIHGLRKKLDNINNSANFVSKFLNNTACNQKINALAESLRHAYFEAFPDLEDAWGQYDLIQAAESDSSQKMTFIEPELARKIAAVRELSHSKIAPFLAYAFPDASGQKPAHLPGFVTACLKAPYRPFFEQIWAVYHDPSRAEASQKDYHEFAESYPVIDLVAWNRAVPTVQFTSVPEIVYRLWALILINSIYEVGVLYAKNKDYPSVAIIKGSINRHLEIMHGLSGGGDLGSLASTLISPLHHLFSIPLLPNTRYIKIIEQMLTYILRDYEAIKGHTYYGQIATVLSLLGTLQAMLQAGLSISPLVSLLALKSAEIDVFQEINAYDQDPTAYLSNADRIKKLQAFALPVLPAIASLGTDFQEEFAVQPFTNERRSKSPVAFILNENITIFYRDNCESSSLKIKLFDDRRIRLKLYNKTLSEGQARILDKDGQRSSLGKHYRAESPDYSLPPSYSDPHWGGSLNPSDLGAMDRTVTTLTKIRSKFQKIQAAIESLAEEFARPSSSQSVPADPLLKEAVEYARGSRPVQPSPLLDSYQIYLFSQWSRAQRKIDEIDRQIANLGDRKVNYRPRTPRASHSALVQRVYSLFTEPEKIADKTTREQFVLFQQMLRGEAPFECEIRVPQGLAQKIKKGALIKAIGVIPPKFANRKVLASIWLQGTANQLAPDCARLRSFADRLVPPPTQVEVVGLDTNRSDSIRVMAAGLLDTAGAGIPLPPAPSLHRSPRDFQNLAKYIGCPVPSSSFSGATFLTAIDALIEHPAQFPAQLATLTGQSIPPSIAPNLVDFLNAPLLTWAVKMGHIQRHIALNRSKLSRELDARRKIRIAGEIQLLYARKTHLRQMLIHTAARAIFTLCYLTTPTVVAYETLNMTTAGKRGRLASIISNMVLHFQRKTAMDRRGVLDLVQRWLLSAKKPLPEFRNVASAYSSSYLYEPLAPTIDRKKILRNSSKHEWDFATYEGSDPRSPIYIDTHENAARWIAWRGLNPSDTAASVLFANVSFPVGPPRPPPWIW